MVERLTGKSFYPGYRFMFPLGAQYLTTVKSLKFSIGPDLNQLAELEQHPAN